MTTYQIFGRYSDLGTPDERADWVEEYAGALSRGCSHDEAEVLASNCAQRDGYNVNRTGGLSICESTLIIEAQIEIDRINNINAGIKGETSCY